MQFNSAYTCSKGYGVAGHVFAGRECGFWYSYLQTVYHRRQLLLGHDTSESTSPGSSLQHLFWDFLFSKSCEIHEVPSEVVKISLRAQWLNCSFARYSQGRFVIVLLITGFSSVYPSSSLELLIVFVWNLT